MAGLEKIEALKHALAHPPAYWHWDFGNSAPYSLPKTGQIGGCAAAMAAHLGIANITELHRIVGEPNFHAIFMSRVHYGAPSNAAVTRQMVLAKLQTITLDPEGTSYGWT